MGGANNYWPTILSSYAGFGRYFGAAGIGGMAVALYILTDRAIPDDPKTPRGEKEDENEGKKNRNDRRRTYPSR